MASTGINNGTLIALYKDGTKVTHSTNVSLDIAQDIIPTTTKDSGGWKEGIPGLRSATGSGDFFFSEDGAVNFEDFYDEVNTRSTFTALWSSNVSGDVTYSGTANVTGIGLSGGVEDAMTYNVSFELTGATTKGTV